MMDCSPLLLYEKAANEEEILNNNTPKQTLVALNIKNDADKIHNNTLIKTTDNFTTLSSTGQNVQKAEKINQNPENSLSTEKMEQIFLLDNSTTMIKDPLLTSSHLDVSKLSVVPSKTTTNGTENSEENGFSSSKFHDWALGTKKKSATFNMGTKGDKNRSQDHSDDPLSIFEPIGELKKKKKNKVEFDFEL